MSEKQVSASRTVPAPAEQIFDLLADPAQHVVIDGSATVQALRGTSQRLHKGAKFGMDMRMGLPYRITNTVVEFEEGRRIAWRHFGGHRWRWELEPIDESSTLVTETFDWSRAHAGFAYPAIGFPRRNHQAIEASLRRLEQHMSE